MLENNEQHVVRGRRRGRGGGRDHGCRSGQGDGLQSSQENGRERVMPPFQQLSTTSSSSKVALTKVRAQRQGSRKRMATSPVAAPIEHPQRQPLAELRMGLLPDRPARKRRSLRHSPEQHSPSTLMMVPESELLKSQAQEEPDAKLEVQHELESLAEPEALVNNHTPVSLGISGGGDAGEEKIILAGPQFGLEANYELVSPVELEAIVNNPTPGPSGICGGGGAGEEETILDMVDPLAIFKFRDETPVASRRTSIGVANDDNDDTIEEWFHDVNGQDSEDEDLNDDRESELDDPLFVTNRLQPADDDGLTAAQVCVIRRDEEANDRQVRELAPSHDYFDFAWSNDMKTFTGKREVFTGTPGPTFPVTHTTRPTDVFYRMFDHDFIEMLVTETNRYAEQKLTKHRQDEPAKVHARIFSWKPTDRDEMVSFLAVIILQGLYPKVNEESYFRYDGYGTTHYFRRIMSYNRYRLLKSLYHFVDNDNLTDRTKLKKITPVIDYFNNKFSTLYRPRQDICIDESLLNWCDKLSFTQRINSKFVKAGVKTYELCESSSGYLWKFFVYTDKDRTNKTASGEASEPHNERYEKSSKKRDFSTTPNIVYHLVQPLLHQGHTLIMNNFYNSPLLARCLKRDGRTDVFGTLRLNREFVPESLKTLTRDDLRCGEVVSTYTTDLALMLWRDANLVSMISTYHPLQICSVEQYDPTKHKPAIILDYKKSMGGLDRKYQLLTAQPFERQANKAWYKKLFLRLYNLALLNSFLIYTYNTNHDISHRQFRIILAEDLLKIHAKVNLATEPRLLPTKRCDEKTTVEPPVATLAVFRSQTHAYVEDEHFPESTGKRYSRCWLCAQAKKISRTVYKCRQCNVNLCLFGCFRNYHKLTTPVLGLLPRVQPG